MLRHSRRHAGPGGSPRQLIQRHISRDILSGGIIPVAVDIFVGRENRPT